MLEFGNFSAVQLIILLGGSFVAGVLNAISGGGGMVLIPMMILTGIPPINAIAINKFQNTVGSIGAISYYNASQKLDWNILLPFIAIASIGAVFGVFVLKNMAEIGLLVTILPYVLIAVAVCSILPKTPQSCQAPISRQRLGAPVWVVAGMYCGSISIGTGPFMIALDRFVFGSELRDAIVRTKPVLLAINLTSLAILMSMGFLIWPIAVMLSVGNFVGARLGARIVTLALVKIAKAIVFTVPVVAAFRLLTNGG
jgi:uncharacterized membrane protein YfcA